MRILAVFDVRVIDFLRKVSLRYARIALFIVFFWFGVLKMILLSPALPLVQELHNTIIPFVPLGEFIIAFGAFEAFIGLLFLIHGLERLAIALLILHMVLTFLPLILLPDMAWQGFLVPTLEGQYILKNLVLIALAMAIGAHLSPNGKAPLTPFTEEG
jgi:uncharacterized membrane protein YkgB